MTLPPVRRASLVLTALAALAGCDCGGDGSGPGAVSGGSSGAGSGETSPEPAVPMGSVEGVVRLAEGAGVPRYEPNPFIGEGARALSPECSPPTAADAEPMHLVAGRAMTNVPVVASGDPARWPRHGAPEVHEIHFRDCRPSPSVVVVTRGDRLRLVNDGDYPFFPHIGPGGFYEALLRGEPRELEIDLAGPQSMECAMTSVCGRTEILAFHHAVHTVTGEDGHFRLDVPADQEIMLTAWHPLLTVEGGTATTRVAPGATVTVEIVVRPLSGATVPATGSAPTAADGTTAAPADPPDEAPF